MVGGFEVPDEGRILLDGRDVTRVPPNRRDVNMVFQDYALFPHMTRAPRTSPSGTELKGERARERIDAPLGASCSRFLELEELGARQAPTSSPAASASASRSPGRSRATPRLLLLDEPLGALDARLRAQVQIELKEIHRRTGKTFVFVTHDQEEALTMSDRIIVMNGGRIEQDGTPESLYGAPRTRFVAGFIGESSFVEGRVVGIDGTRLRIDWQGLEVHGSVGAARPAVDRPITAVIRPEGVSVGVAPGTEGALRARVRQRLFKGNRTLLTLALGERDDGPTLLAQADAGFAPDARETWVRWDPAALVALLDEA